MRLHRFIVVHMEPILLGWEDFARKIWPGDAPGVRLLRDHAEEMLRAVAEEMQAPQSGEEQFDKSVGEGARSRGSDQVDRSSARHAVARVESGFDLRSLVAEYRALRASVLHLWSTHEEPDPAFLIADITRFNEAVDQSLAESITSYSERVDHSREIFLGILGHDLRTPLHAVAMGAGILESHGESSALARKMGTQIATSVQVMQRMIGDLLDFTGTRLGAKMTVTREPTDLVVLCREVLEELRVVHPSRDFHFEGPVEARGDWDRPRVRQLISNLLCNAVQHGAPAGPVSLSLKASPDAVVIRVRNEGHPIPADALALIFEPLRRNANDELSRPPGSIGLGLYIAREVASVHGGTIQVTSDEKETIFQVRLPGLAAAAAP